MLAYWINWLKAEFQKEEGQGLVEYALIIVLVAIAVIATLSVLSGGVQSALSKITSGLVLP